MPLILYSTSMSPSVRAVLMLADHLGLELELKEVDLVKSDQLKEDFKRLNPQHTIPVLDDSGFILWDSHAILAYLVTQYEGAKAESLYPKDAKKRALVDAKLHFDTGYAFPALRIPLSAAFYHGQKGPMTELQQTSLIAVYDFLNKFLSNSKFLAGDHLTITDISLYSSVTSLDTMIQMDQKKFPNLTKWVQEMTKQPFSKVNRPGLESFKNIIQGLF